MNFSYIFEKEGHEKKRFDINLDANTLSLQQPTPESLPEWTLLKTHQCSNCPLDTTKIEYCPVAAAIVDVINFFKASVSYEKIKVIVESKNRNYVKDTTLQRGVSSMLGIYMVSSGCPILAKLKPMVKFHLPFADLQETMYRAVSMHLVKQFVKKRKGMEAAIDLRGLVKIYEEVHAVNEAFHHRLSTIKGEDANVNALIILDNFADYINFTLDENMLNEIDELFEDLE